MLGVNSEYSQLSHETNELFQISQPGTRLLFGRENALPNSFPIASKLPSVSVRVEQCSEAMEV